MAWSTVESAVHLSFNHRIWCSPFAKSALLSCLALFVADSNAALAAQPAAISRPSFVSLFNANRFPEALASCEHSIKEHPLDPSLRYWHASILIKLQRATEAHQEFEYVYTYSKDKTERAYALQACQLLDASPNVAPVLGVAGQTPQGSPTVTPASGNPAVDRISRQADADSTNILIDGTRRQTYLTTRGEAEANYAANLQAVDAMTSARIKVGNTTVPRYTADEIQFARNQAIDRANQVRSENARRAGQALQEAQQKAFETQASAANLAAQFNSGSKTGFHLREEGTTLYVRQYDAPTAHTSNSLNPAVVTISDTANGTKGNFDSPMQATARALDPAAQKQLDLDAKKNVRSNVFGHLYSSQHNLDEQ